MNREERRKKKKSPPGMDMNQQAMAFMIIRLAEFFNESMVEAGLTDEQIQAILAGVAKRQDQDRQTGYVFGLPEEHND